MPLEAIGLRRRIDRLDIRVPVAGIKVADQVAAMGTAWAMAADVIAKRIEP